MTEGMNVKDYDYDLPEELIAQDPLEDRSSSRLMVLDRQTGDVEHRHFTDILDQRKLPTRYSPVRHSVTKSSFPKKIK